MTGIMAGGIWRTPSDIKEYDASCRRDVNSLWIDWALKRGHSADCTCTPAIDNYHLADGFHREIRVAHDLNCGIHPARD